VFRRTIPFALLLASSLVFASIARAQIPAAKPAPLTKVPSSDQTCAAGRPCAEVAPVMLSSAQGASALEENLRHLTDVIGGRVSGTPAAHRAATWTAEAFRRAGADTVSIEKFTMPVSWAEGHTRATILAPEPFPVRLVANAWTPPTPKGGIEADIVDAGDGDDAGFAKAGAAARGAIALVHSKPLETWEDLLGEYSRGPGVVERAKKAGARAVFWMSSRPSLLLYRHTLTVDGRLEKLPQATVAREDAERIARFLAAGEKVRVRFDAPNQAGGPVESENVIAEIRGYDKPEEFVLLGAHLDSWELGTGALDNGCNAALVIEAARVVKSSGTVPRRSIRFALFTGEEEGLLGSAAYAHAHRAELDGMVAAVVFDSGIGRVTGYSLGGRKDTLAAVRELLEPLASLGVANDTLDAGMDTDNFDFLLEGVPTLVANQEPANYMLNYHAASDTFDKVDFAELKRSTGIAAVTAYALANAENRIGRRQSRAEIERLLEETGLEADMRATGFWPYWEKSERGRQK